ncbi:hypothetical protein V4C53_10545 [Paraburkholderia azotifigens]|uniref:hypothetical protein n=1 Tax=Paraburkholderia azotifigens TaxID=2057004 RepID=UPI003175725D
MLKNIFLERARYLGTSTYRARRKDTGIEIRTFSAVSIELSRNAFNTRRTFAHCTAKFIDFCIEGQMQSETILSQRLLSDGYLMYLEYGSEQLKKLGFNSEPHLAPFR